MSLAASVLGSCSLHHELVSDARTEFEREAFQVNRALELQLNSYVDLLLGLRGLFQASDTVTREAFRDFVATMELARRFPAVRSLNFAQHVSARTKEAFERQVRRGGNPGFEIIPPGDREQYLVLLYSEPVDATIRLGMDVRAARPDLPRGLDAMRDSGEIVSSGEIVLKQPGLRLAARAPVYARGMAAGTTEQRRLAYVGSVGIAFSLMDLVREVVETPNVGRVHIRIHNLGMAGSVSSLASPSDENLLIDSNLITLQRGTGGQSRYEPLKTSMQLQLGGRALGVYFEGALEDFSDAPAQLAAPAVLCLGATISMLLFGLIRSLSQTGEALAGAVAARTRELRQTNLRLNNEIEMRAEAEQKMVEAAERERGEIGAELHDNLAQKLTAAAFMAQALALAGDAELGSTGNRAGEQIHSLLVEVIEQMRLIAKGLNPVAPRIESLAHALERLASDNEVAYGIKCHFRDELEFTEVEPGSILHLYRVAQEAIRNAVVHGNAKCVAVTLKILNGRPNMRIEDDGVGFDDQVAQRTGGVGLHIMRQRCSILGLRFSIGRRSEGGSVVTVS